MGQALREPHPHGHLANQRRGGCVPAGDGGAGGGAPAGHVERPLARRAAARLRERQRLPADGGAVHGGQARRGQPGEGEGLAEGGHSGRPAEAGELGQHAAQAGDRLSRAQEGADRERGHGQGHHADVRRAQGARRGAGATERALAAPAGLGAAEPSVRAEERRGGRLLGTAEAADRQLDSRRRVRRQPDAAGQGGAVPEEPGGGAARRGQHEGGGDAQAQRQGGGLDQGGLPDALQDGHAAQRRDGRLQPDGGHRHDDGRPQEVAASERAGAGQAHDPEQGRDQGRRSDAACRGHGGVPVAGQGRLTDREEAEEARRRDDGTW
mmetsp:Transcript_12070/g.30115  ORF Transcript_12070/g.30115 Transcript_12070/m.30115 type:complete len:324 (-) Transcript_12070:126-1097(-)